MSGWSSIAASIVVVMKKSYSSSPTHSEELLLYSKFVKIFKESRIDILFGRRKTKN